MRKTALLIAAATAGLIGLQGCKPQADSGDVRAAIEARNQELMTALGKGDAAAVAALYTSNAQLMPPNAPMMSGRDAIQKAWQQFADSKIKLELVTSEVEAHGDTANEIGVFKVSDPDGMPADSGKYIVLWKRENGSWFLHRDIWNSDNVPPAVPPAAAPSVDGVPVPDVPEAPPVPDAPPAP